MGSKKQTRTSLGLPGAGPGSHGVLGRIGGIQISIHNIVSCGRIKLLKILIRIPLFSSIPFIFLGLIKTTSLTDLESDCV